MALRGFKMESVQSIKRLKVEGSNSGFSRLTVI